MTSARPLGDLLRHPPAAVVLEVVVGVGADPRVRRQRRVGHRGGEPGVVSPFDDEADPLFRGRREPILGTYGTSVGTSNDGAMVAPRSTALEQPTACFANDDRLPSSSKMDARLHKFLALLAAVGMVCTPIFAGKVVCTTESGHRAIEPAHDLTGCPEIERADHASGEKSESCEDQVLPSHLVSRSMKTSSASMDTPCFSLSLIPSPLIFSYCSLSLALRVPPPSPDSPPAGYAPLTTVILLI